METFLVGNLPCDMISRQDFANLCNMWLQGSTCRHIVTLNPEMVVEAQHNSQFAQAVTTADIRVPDGAGIIWAQWYMRSHSWPLLPSLMAFSLHSVERITGVEAIDTLARLAAGSQASMYLLGGTRHQREYTQRYVIRRYPGITIHISPDHVFDISGPKAVLEDIGQKKPDILCVAYGAPKQSNWIAQHRLDLLSVKIAIGVGGALAILSEEKPRAPLLLRRHNMEWLWRLMLEPARACRIWRALVEFPWLVHGQKQKSGLLS
ncbi:MAG: WecB/TagA/CpsF family glycosyltransferase [Candidatus Andersenbacteria bacterium]|nr:WecB/TagA/CpsF family glycosyltransferase [Candidatus Andersenbacteria bacterium]